MLSLQTHEFEKVPNTSGQYKITRVVPYVRFGSRDGAFYIQGGRVFSETGEEVKNPPTWVYDEADKLGPVVKAEVGWQGRPDASQRAEPEKQTLSLKK